jgi:transposase InsO family protein
MTASLKLARRKLSLLDLAKDLDNVSKACRLMGSSRHLKGLQVSSGGVRGVGMRNGLLTKHERLLRLEKATAEKKVELSDEQVRLLERFSPVFRERHIEAPQTGALVAVDTFHVGTLTGVGKLDLQTAIDCHSRFGWARLYTSKLPITAVHLMNNDVLPTFEAAGATIDTVLSDNGREFCGQPDRHPYELFLQLEAIEHRTTKRPQSNGSVERFHRTLLDEHFRVEGRKTWFETVEVMQAVLDDYLDGYNQRRPHQGRGMNGRLPAHAFRDGLPSSAPSAITVSSAKRKEKRPVENQPSSIAI